MVKCSVEGCGNYQGKKNGSVRFFSFPKNPKQSQEWLRVCGRGVKVNMTIGRICSEHFSENDWKLQHVLLNIPAHKRKLKAGAIPSINLPRSIKSGQREDSISKRQQKELVEEAISNYNRKYVMEISSHFAEPEVDVPNFCQNPGRPKNPQQDPLGPPGPEVEHLARQNRALKMHIRKLMKRRHLAEAAISSLGNIFTEGQIKRMRNPNKKYKWSYEDISSAASLYASGPAAYAQLIKKNYPLPTPATLKKWTTTLKLKPGILTSILKLLSDLKYEEIDRLCILSFHEFPLKLEGHEEVSSNGEPYKNAQSFIVRGLMSDWKYIIYYSYDCLKAGPVVREIIRALKEINFTVVAVVSGVGHLKIPLWIEMQVDSNRPCVEVIPGEKVFFFGNVPHLIKSFRNCFVAAGFDVNGKILNVDPLRELLGLDMADMELDFQLTEAHISQKKIIRQDVQLAWELLTYSVANALRRCVSMGKIYSENAIECSDVIQLFSDWLDVFNASSTTMGESEAAPAYGLNLEDQNEIISLMNDFIKKINYGRGKAMYPFQKGILLNNVSLIHLRRYLEEKYNIGYVVTNRLNQDDLEQLFMIRRPKTLFGRKPTALEFKYRINSWVTSNLSVLKI